MKHYVKLILILVIPLVAALVYAASGLDWGIEKINLDESWLEGLPLDIGAVNEEEETFPEVEADTLVAEDEVPVDTTHKRILFFGDSMVEGLCVHMADYARENGYELYGVSWYASTTLGWASHLDSLQNWIAWSDPDYVMVSIGGNEIETRDSKRRSECIRKIMDVIGSRPCVWIGTPSWVPNPTITEIERKAVGNGRYFDSTKLKLDRAKDHMHPTYQAYAMWMDSIAVWMQSQKTEYPIRMRRPAYSGTRMHNMIVLDVHGRRKGAQKGTQESGIMVTEEGASVNVAGVEPVKTDTL